MQQNQRFCLVLFHTFYILVKTLCAYITHSTTQLLTVWSEIGVCYASSSEGG